MDCDDFQFAYQLPNLFEVLELKRKKEYIIKLVLKALKHSTVHNKYQNKEKIYGMMIQHTRLLILSLCFHDVC